MAGATRTRPIRVAFLVDENEHWRTMLSAVFADCYSRWGGRFNLIIPCDDGAPREAFMPWLNAYDPDIIYSFVDISDEVLARLREALDPSFLVGHDFFDDKRDERAFRPKLPLPGLNALSTCLKASLGDVFSGRRQVQIVDKYPS